MRNVHRLYLFEQVEQFQRQLGRSAKLCEVLNNRLLALYVTLSRENVAPQLFKRGFRGIWSQDGTVRLYPAEVECRPIGGRPIASL